MSSAPDLITARPRTQSPQPGKVYSIVSATTKPLGGVVALVIYILCGLAAIYLDAPPRVASSHAPEGFSVERAMRDVQAISRTPHAVGSVEHDRVRDYLVQTLSQIGLSIEIQKTTGVDKRFGQAGTVENIIARLKGTGNGKAVLLAGHYDSVFTGPGAADDGAAIAALLECARQLKALPQLKRDVIFLFTDGEEVGLLGARAFVQESPWASHVGTVLNFEARGVSGPVIMFETSNRNGWLIKKFGEAASHPVANSLAYEIYKTLPNDTDFSVFKQAGYSGLNFAFIDGLAAYHTDLDNMQKLDPASLQHHGTYAIALAKAFANDSVDDPKENDAVFFEIPGIGLIHYSKSVSIALLGITVALLVLVMRLALRNKSVSLRSFLVALAALAAGLILAGVIAVSASWLSQKFASYSDRVQAGLVHHAALWVAAFASFGLAASAALYVRLRKAIEIQAAALAGLTVWFVLLTAATILLPGGSYVLLWPLLFSVAGWLAALSSPKFFSKAFASLLLVVLALPAVFIALLLAHKIFTALDANAALPVTVMLGLLLMLLVWQLGPERMPYPKLLPGVFVVAGVLFGIAAIAVSGYDTSHPRFDSLFYATDLDTGKQVWASHDENPDRWTSQFFSSAVSKAEMPAFFPGSSKKFLQAPAPQMSFAPPKLGVIEDRTTDGGRHLRLKIQSGRGAPRLSILLESKASPSNVLINGKTVDPMPLQKDTWLLQYYGAGRDGIELAFSVAPSAAVHINVEDISNDLPEQIASRFQARPAEIIAAPNRFNNAILVKKSFAL